MTMSPFTSIIPTHTYVFLSYFPSNNLIFVNTLTMIPKLFFSSPIITTLTNILVYTVLLESPYPLNQSVLNKTFFSHLLFYYQSGLAVG